MPAPEHVARPDIAGVSASAGSKVAVPVGTTVTVRVAASSANLGPGFDALGLALALHDEVTVTVIEPNDGVDVRLEVSGEGADDVPRDASHLVVQALNAGLRAASLEVPGLALICHNQIPHGRGLGSSAAAVVAGLVAAQGLARALGDTQLDSELDTQTVLRLATDFEGHADNVAACLFGGLTIAWESERGVQATQLEISDDIAAVAFVPTQSLSTHAARGMLPDVVPHHDAATNSGRAALLVAALSSRPDLLFDATEDRLHQHYREAGMPASLALLRELRGRGYAAIISGAGPTVVVLGRPTDLASLEVELHAGWRRLELPIEVAPSSAQRPA